MSQPPAFQFYARDWLMSTRHLTLDARAVYLDLLCLSWDQDGLPSDLHETLGYLAVTKQKFDRLWPLIECKWERAKDGRWRNSRQEKQREELAELRRKRAEAGARGGKQTQSKGSSK